MKKNCIKAALFVMVFLRGLFLFAQETNEEPKMQKDRLHWSLGLLLEGNMNVPKDCALGTGLYGMVVLPDWVKVGRFSAGAKLLYLKDIVCLIRRFCSVGIFMTLKN